MADASDVEQALVAFIAGALYPTGTANPSVTGDAIKVYRGWPKSAQLDTDLKTGIVNVSVYSQPGVGRNTTRYFKDWQTLPTQPNTPQLALTVSGLTITVGGAIQAGDVAAIKVGKSQAYGVAVSAGSTTSTIAAALAALAVVNFPGTVAAGPVITFTTSVALGVAVGGNITSILELRQQLKGWQVTVWASTPAKRDAVSKAVDSAFAAIERITLVDQQRARLIYESDRSSDANQLQQEYRRDFFYSVEYSTTTTEVDQIITAFITSLVDSNGFAFATSIDSGSAPILSSDDGSILLIAG